MATRCFDFLLFDLDGTLVDSVRDLTCALNLLGTELGHCPLTVERVRTIVGDGATKLIQRAFGEDHFRPEHLARFLDIYAAHLSDTTRCYPGILELLEQHPAEKLALVTNKPHRLTVQLLEELELTRYFRVIIGGDSYPRKKPDPLPVKMALQDLGAPPDRSIMIGDHHTDLNAGRGAGIATCFCAYGLGNTGGLTADYQVDQPRDLLELFPGNRL